MSGTYPTKPFVIASLACSSIIAATLLCNGLSPAAELQNFAGVEKSEEVTKSPEGLVSQLTETILFLYEDKTPPSVSDLVPGRILGTAFVVGIPDPLRKGNFFPFVVTAKHVISDKASVLGRYSLDAGGKPAFVRYNLQELRKAQDVWDYPNDEGVDIVVFRTLSYKGTKSRVIPIDYIASQDDFVSLDIDATDRVIIPCLMLNYPGVTQNYPIFRDGSIALITQEAIDFSWGLGGKRIHTRQRVIFINSTLNEGFSGAPVFLWPGIRITPKGNKIGGRPWLLGIVHGFQPQHRKVIDVEGEDITVIKKPEFDPITRREVKPQRTIPVVTQENPGTGIIFPSWQLLKILQSDAVKTKIDKLSSEIQKTPATVK